VSTWLGGHTQLGEAGEVVEGVLHETPRGTRTAAHTDAPPTKNRILTRRVRTITVASQLVAILPRRGRLSRSSEFSTFVAESNPRVGRARLGAVSSTRFRRQTHSTVPVNILNWQVVRAICLGSTALAGARASQARGVCAFKCLDAVGCERSCGFVNGSERVGK
jgi:hypothetical protein